MISQLVKNSYFMEAIF